MTLAQPTVLQQADAAFDEVQKARAEAMAGPPGVERCLHLAWIADVEAAWWAVLFEHSRTRTQWRAALVAREYALQSARSWRRQAAAPPAKPLPVAVEVA